LLSVSADKLDRLLLASSPVVENMDSTGFSASLIIFWRIFGGSKKYGGYG